MWHPLGPGRAPMHIFQGSSRFPGPRSCLHYKSLMHFLLFSLQWKCHLSKASCYHVFPMPNTWPLRRGFYLYIFSDLYFSFKELHALRHPKRSQHKEVRLHKVPLKRTIKTQGWEPEQLPRAANNSAPLVDVITKLFLGLGPYPHRSRRPPSAGSAAAPAPANQPDAATYWHLGPGKATAVSVWRRILTPATEGDKRRRDGRGGRKSLLTIALVKIETKPYCWTALQMNKFWSREGGKKNQHTRHVLNAVRVQGEGQGIIYEKE